MAKKDVVTQVTEIAQPILDSLGLELVDIEYRKEGHGMILRLFIDKPGGIMLDDCACFSRELSEILDVEEVIPTDYNLEVSSPGLNRPLTKAADFERYKGKLVKVRTYEMFADNSGNRRKTFLGRLDGFENGSISLTLNEGQSASIPFDRVAKANLEFEF
ncbi:MAG: ribosome maturation factor RimP [Geobacteraceae bacterium]|nr:ribosome maturation factor RimP [Geobacteraceae bacterium]